MTFSLNLNNHVQDGRRNFGLDLIRVMAISLVFYAHAVSGVVKGVLIGDLGVELFFVLSGFLVGRYFFVKDRVFNSGFVLKFMSKRWLRTLPLYYTAILVKLLLTGQAFSDVWYYMVFVQNYFSLSFFSVSWSLSIEEWFYLLLPLMSLLILRKSAYAYRMALCIAAVYAASFLLRGYYVSHQMSWEAMMSTIHLRMDSLLTGVALVFVKYEYAAFYNRLKSPGVFCFALIGISLFLYAFADSYLTSRLNTLAFFRVFGFTLLSIFIALLLPFLETVSVNKEKLPGRVLNRIMITGSILTYAFYLVHSDVIDYFSALQLGGVEKTICAFSVSLILSWILYLCIEKPFLSLKNRISI